MIFGRLGRRFAALLVLFNGGAGAREHRSVAVRFGGEVRSQSVVFFRFVRRPRLLVSGRRSSGARGPLRRAGRSSGACRRVVGVVGCDDDGGRRKASAVLAMDGSGGRDGDGGGVVREVARVVLKPLKQESFVEDRTFVHVFLVSSEERAAAAAGQTSDARRMVGGASDRLTAGRRLVGRVLRRHRAGVACPVQRRSSADRHRELSIAYLPHVRVTVFASR